MYDIIFEPNRAWSEKKAHDGNLYLPRFKKRFPVLFRFRFSPPITSGLYHCSNLRKRKTQYLAFEPDLKESQAQKKIPIKEERWWSLDVHTSSGMVRKVLQIQSDREHAISVKGYIAITRDAENFYNLIRAILLERMNEEFSGISLLFRK